MSEEALEFSESDLEDWLIRIRQRPIPVEVIFNLCVLVIKDDLKQRALIAELRKGEHRES